MTMVHSQEKNKTGLVIESGAGATFVVAIHNGNEYKLATRFMLVAGIAITGRYIHLAPKERPLALNTKK